MEGKEWESLVAFKTEMKLALSTLTQTAKDRLLSELADPECQQEWIDAYRHRLRRKEKDAVRLYPELLRMIGPENSVTVMIQQRFGCENEDQLAAIIERYREAEALTDEQRFERCLQYAEGYVKREPQRLKDAVLRLKNTSRAEVEVENGVH